MGSIFLKNFSATLKWSEMNGKRGSHHPIFDAHSAHRYNEGVHRLGSSANRVSRAKTRNRGSGDTMGSWLQTALRFHYRAGHESGW